MKRNVLTPTLKGVIKACCWPHYCSGVQLQGSAQVRVLLQYNETSKYSFDNF